jgi:hypothetical protein
MPTLAAPSEVAGLRAPAAAPAGRFPVARLALVTLGALVVHGYHFGVEDGEIYVPAIRKLLHPNTYPYATEFFLSHERLSVFAPVVAWSARMAHLPTEWAAFLWYLVTLFATFAGCWMLATICFRSARARWCAVLVFASVMTMPATNTGLLLVDPYITARSFSTPLTLFALVALLKRRSVLAALVIALTAAVHPQMAAYLVFLAAVLWLAERGRQPGAEQKFAPALLFALPLHFQFGPAPQPYREALYARDFYFLSTWTWYDWLGLLAPLAFLVWFGRGRLRGTTPEFARLSVALVPFGLVSIVAGALVGFSHQLDMYARLQPLRCFHLITLVFIVLFAGVIGEYAAKNRIWVIPTLCIALATAMFFVARDSYPNSAQIEFPGRTTSSNDWVNALLWIRHNTPAQAVFAVDSRYFLVPGVDVHGFRAVSGRAALADYFKDGGAVAVFPTLAPEWKQMTNATYGLNHFTEPDFVRLSREYPVDWTIIHGPAPAGMVCPYQERGYSVCRIPGTPDEETILAAAHAPQPQP